MPGRIAGLPRAALPPTRSIGLVDTSGRPSSSWSPSLYPGPQSPPPHTQQTLTADAIGVPRAATLRADPTCSSPRGSAGPPPPPIPPQRVCTAAQVANIDPSSSCPYSPICPPLAPVNPPLNSPGGEEGPALPPAAHGSTTAPGFGSASLLPRNCTRCAPTEGWGRDPICSEGSTAGAVQKRGHACVCKGVQGCAKNVQGCVRMRANPHPHRSLPPAQRSPRTSLSAPTPFPSRGGIAQW